MNDLVMLERYFPGGKLEGGIELANKLGWGLSVKMSGDGYVVTSGEEVILRVDDKDALQTFYYGLGLAYSILPEEVFSTLEKTLHQI